MAGVRDWRRRPTHLLDAVLRPALRRQAGQRVAQPGAGVVQRSTAGRGISLWQNGSSAKKGSASLPELQHHISKCIRRLQNGSGSARKGSGPLVDRTWRRAAGCPAPQSPRLLRSPRNSKSACQPLKTPMVINLSTPRFKRGLLKECAAPELQISTPARTTHAPGWCVDLRWVEDAPSAVLWVAQLNTGSVVGWGLWINGIRRTQHVHKPTGNPRSGCVAGRLTN